MNPKKLWVVSVIATLILTASAGAVQAGEADGPGGWEFAIVPYLWGLSLDGSVTVKEQETDVDL